MRVCVCAKLAQSGMMIATLRIKDGGKRLYSVNHCQVHSTCGCVVLISVGDVARSMRPTVFLAGGFAAQNGN